MKLSIISTGPSQNIRAYIREQVLRELFQGHRFYQLGSLAISALSRPIRLRCRADGKCLQFKILDKVCLNPRFEYALSPCEGPIESSPPVLCKGLSIKAILFLGSFLNSNFRFLKTYLPIQLSNILYGCPLTPKNKPLPPF